MPMSDYMRSLRAKVGSQLLEVPAVSVIVRDEAGRVLLVRHSNGDVWVTPGGAIEPTEAPADAAVREMWEETGLEVELTRVLGVYGGPEFIVTYENGDRVSYLMVFFEATPVGGAPRPDGVETLEVRYFTREEARAATTPPWMQEVLGDVFAARPAAAFRPPAWSPPSPA